MDDLTSPAVPPKLLFIHSGSPKKRLTFDAASALGFDIFLFNPEHNWASSYAHQTLITAGLSLPRILDLAGDLHARLGLDGVVTFWEEDVPTCALVAQRLGLRGNSPAAALRSRSKFRMRQAFLKAGIPVPPFARVSSPASLLKACEEVGLPAVLKPEWGSDSEWVTRVDSTQEALEVYREVRRRVRVQDCIYSYPTGHFILEGYLTGPEVSIEGVVQHGRVTIYAIIDKAKMLEPSFIERGECTPSRLPMAVQQDIRQMVARGVQALGLENSGIHAEVKITPDGPRIVEIGARMGGDCIHALVKRVYDIDLAEENIRASMGLPVHPEMPAHGYAISRTLVPDRPGRVVLQSTRALRRSRNLIEVVLTKHPGDQVQVPPEGYDNLAWISVWGRNYREAERRLETRSSRLENAFLIQPDEILGDYAHGG
ncbi:MAG: ATP-grasp domain-containing protein [Candidatus Latescibacteria bacterium]|nr:ATP-grasp domain-containing protein [Candidatus Latescibacterota bacterium]